MKEKAVKTLAWLIAGLALLLIIGWYAMPWNSGETGQISSLIGNMVYLLYTLASLSVGMLIILRAKGNYYGWVWLMHGFFIQFLSFWQAYATQALVTAPGSLPFGWGAVALTAVGWVSWLTSLVFLLLLFPTGHPPTPHWRFVIWVVLICAFCVVPVIPFVPGVSGFVPLENPYGATGFMGQVAKVLIFGSVLLIFAGIFAGVISLFVRFRRAAGPERQQLKWFVYAATFFGAFWISDFFIELPGVWERIKEGTFYAFLPISIGMAILRHRLWDIDVIIRRTLVWAILTGLLGLVYFGGVTLLQSVFSAVSGQQSAVAIVISTLAIAALFNPLWKRVQEFVDRRFYRRNYDAEQALASFAALAREEVDLEEISARLLQVVEETVQPEHASLWLRLTQKGSKR